MDMKHIKRNFSLKAWVRAPGVDFGGGAEAKRTSDSLNEGLPIKNDQSKVSKKMIFFLRKR